MEKNSKHILKNTTFDNAVYMSTVI